MKWYFAINEAGSSGGIGWHAKLAVLSANKVGGLDATLLYYGARNAFTAWMEAHGVRVLDSAPSFLAALQAAERDGRYPPQFIGHWLRAGVCLIERDDPFVLYTDCDVIFRKKINFALCRPETLAAAPEFKPDGWNYFNAGVMVQNVARLRQDYQAFEAYIVENLWSAQSRLFNDQWAYNDFYRRSWSRLTPLLNWKPYWGYSDVVPVVHFHGPKLDTLRAILDGRLGWESAHERQVGSLFIANLPHYVAVLEDLLRLLEGDFEGRALIEGIVRDAGALYRIAPYDRVDVSFLDHRFFDEP